MKTKGRDYSQLLIWAALAVSVTRFAGAFVASDVGQITNGWSIVLTAFMAVSGVGMGVLDVLGMAYLFDGWRRVLPKSGDKASNRFKILTGFIVGMAFVGVGILVPFTVSRIRADSMHGVMGDVDWLWSVAVNLAPFLLIGGIMTAQSGIVTILHDASISTHDASITKNISLHTCKQCEASFSTLPELASHTRWQHKNGNGKASA